MKSPPTTEALTWIVLHPTEDNPPVVLYSASTYKKAKAWADKNQGIVVSLDTQFAECGFDGISDIVREYEPDIPRQVQALKTLLEIAEGGGE